MHNYDIILWDVDATLLDFKKSQEHALTFCFAKYGHTITQEIAARYDVINDSYWKRLELGEIDKKTVLSGRFIQLFAELDITDIPLEDMQETYQRELGNVYYYLEDSYDLCLSLKGTCRQYIVTNGVASTQRHKLQLAGFDRIMDDIFISEEMGAAKPSPLFFAKCFEKIGAYDKSRMVIVGDSLTSDMRGGSNAGIDTCWYNPRHLKNDTAVHITYEIHTLDEIKTIL